MKNWQRCARMSLPVLLAFALAACGNSSDATDSGDASAAAAAVPDPVTTAPTTITITTPLAKPPTPGKTFFWLQCELPICTKITTGVKAATDAAGWKYESLVFKDPAVGLESALQRKPDAIGITGIPSAALKSQLKAAAAAGIPVVTCSPGPEQPSAETYAAVCSRTTYSDGANLASWAIKDSGGKAHIVTITIPAYAILGTALAGTTDTVKKYCADCSSEELDVTVDDLAGGQIGPKLVAYLQSHPDTNYVLFSFADLEIGIPEALEAAGYGDKVKLIGNGTGPQQYQSLIKGNGMDAAWVAWPAVYSGWEMVDAAIRRLDDGKLPDGYQKEIDALPTYIVDNADAAKALAPSYDFEGPAAYQDQFKKLWGLG